MLDSVIYITGRIIPAYCGGWIYKTINGGTSWDDMTPASPLNYIELSSVYFFDAERGFVAGECNGSLNILRTHDGGDTWEEKTTDKFVQLIDVQFVNDSSVFFIAENGGLYLFGASNDLFDSWEILYESGNWLPSFQVINDSTTFLCMEDNGNISIMKSLDGGNTWNKKQSIWGGINQVFFRTDDVGYILGDVFYKTMDGGETWTLDYVSESWSDDDWVDVYFIDKNIGFVGSNECAVHHCSGDMFITHDGGKTWNPIYSGGYIASLVFLNDLVGYYVSTRSITKTTDQGQNWTKIYENNYESTGFEIRLNDMGFMDENLVWAVGEVSWSNNDSSGVGILGTIDGGENWDLVWKYPDGYPLNSIYSTNTATWAVGESGLMVKYTEHENWQIIQAETDLPLNDVFFSDENHGWIAGGYVDEDNRNLILLRTTDGGATWKEITDINFWINDMYFKNNLQGWAVGDGIIYTEDGGESWISQVDSLGLNFIHFKDGYGWAVGGNGLILRTEDGIAWVDQRNEEIHPSKYNLSQNYPNPFNPSTTVEFDLPKSSDVKIEVYNTTGQKIQTLVNTKMSAGSHQVEFDAQNLSSGVYFYKIEAGEFQDVKKMVLIK